MQTKQKDQKQGKQERQQKQQQDPKTSADKRTDAMSKKGSDAAGKQKGKAAGEPKAEERPVDDPMRLNLRVGLVRKVWRHPEADKSVGSTALPGPPDASHLNLKLYPSSAFQPAVRYGLRALAALSYFFRVYLRAHAKIFTPFYSCAILLCCSR